MFNNLANELLNGSLLQISDTCRLRLTEIEIYYYNESHQDEYVHKHLHQKRKGFYMHQYKNGTYKSGTWKGLDITYGDDDTYFGVLIRGVIDTKEGSKHIDGPCNSVNYIMKCLNCDNLEDLAQTIPRWKIVSSDDSMLQYPIYHSTRIGLSDKYPEFKIKPYRFATIFKKEKSKMFLV